MKRRALVRHLEREGVVLIRDGSAHSIVRNPSNGRAASIPRHAEIKESTARGICDQLGVPRP